jgi:hypothetical protein
MDFDEFTLGSARQLQVEETQDGNPCSLPSGSLIVLVLFAGLTMSGSDS